MHGVGSVGRSYAPLTAREAAREAVSTIAGHVQQRMPQITALNETVKSLTLAQLPPEYQEYFRAPFIDKVSYHARGMQLKDLDQIKIGEIHLVCIAQENTCEEYTLFFRTQEGDIAEQVLTTEQINAIKANSEDENIEANLNNWLREPNGGLKVITGDVTVSGEAQTNVYPTNYYCEVNKDDKKYILQRNLYKPEEFFVLLDTPDARTRIGNVQTPFGFMCIGTQYRDIQENVDSKFPTIEVSVALSEPQSEKTVLNNPIYDTSENDGWLDPHSENFQLLLKQIEKSKSLLKDLTPTLAHACDHTKWPFMPVAYTSNTQGSKSDNQYWVFIRCIEKKFVVLCSKAVKEESELNQAQSGATSSAQDASYGYIMVLQDDPKTLKNTDRPQHHFSNREILNIFKKFNLKAVAPLVDVGTQQVRKSSYNREDRSMQVQPAVTRKVKFAREKEENSVMYRQKLITFATNMGPNLRVYLGNIPLLGFQAVAKDQSKLHYNGWGLGDRKLANYCWNESVVSAIDFGTLSKLGNHPPPPVSEITEVIDRPIAPGSAPGMIAFGSTPIGAASEQNFDSTPRSNASEQRLPAIVGTAEIPELSAPELLVVKHTAEVGSSTVIERRTAATNEENFWRKQTALVKHIYTMRSDNEGLLSCMIEKSDIQLSVSDLDKINAELAKHYDRLASIDNHSLSDKDKEKIKKNKIFIRKVELFITKYVRNEYQKYVTHLMSTNDNRLHIPGEIADLLQIHQKTLLSYLNNEDSDKTSIDLSGIPAQTAKQLTPYITSLYDMIDWDKVDKDFPSEQPREEA